MISWEWRSEYRVERCRSVEFLQAEFQSAERLLWDFCHSDAKDKLPTPALNVEIQFDIIVRATIKLDLIFFALHIQQFIDLFLSHSHCSNEGLWFNYSSQLDSRCDFTEQTLDDFFVHSLSQSLSVLVWGWKHVLICKPLFICGFGRHMAWERSAFMGINNKSDRPPTTRTFIS